MMNRGEPDMKLYFASRYYKSLARGEKRVTIRLSTRLKAGDVVDIFAGRRFVYRAKIKRVEERRIKEIDAEILKQEGMDSMRELMDALIEHYGPLAADPERKVKVIRFEPIDASSDD